MLKLLVVAVNKIISVLLMINFASHAIVNVKNVKLAKIIALNV